MKSLVTILLVALSFAAGPVGPTIGPKSSVDDVLDALNARGKDLTSLSADLRMSDIDPSIGETSSVRTGHMFYRSPPGGDARWRAVFDKKIVGNKLDDAKHEWSYADGKLIDRDYRALTQRTTQVLKPGQTMELFNLDGPFPLPLGQDKADVHKHFDVSEPAPDKSDPAGSVHLQLSPLAGTDLARKFKTIDVWVDPATNMPTRITVMDANQTSQKQTDLANVKINDPVKDSDLEMKKLDSLKGWDLKDEGS